VRSPWRLALTLLVGAVLGLAGCTGGGRPVMSGTLTIAASPALTDMITRMVHAYTTTYPGVRIETFFEPDSRLAERLAQTPPPDLVVAEDRATLEPAGLAAEAVPVARGQLVLAVPAGNPLPLRDVTDLARPEVRVALCDPDEPCGAITAEVLAAAEVTPVTTLVEPDVRSALRQVTDGQADAALVYRSDAIAADDEVMVIELTHSSVALAEFVAAVHPAAADPAAARAFLDYFTSATVRDALIQDGFRPVD
jgi:molybdate transport system substrate-binding protein